MHTQSQAAESAPPAVPQTALVPVRPRADGWTPEKQRRFLDHLADTGCVKAAAAEVGMTEQSAYRLRRRADAQAFDAAWEAALERALQRLAGVAFERAINGAPRFHYWRGELVGEERVPSDRLLIWLMKNGASVLRRSRERREVARDWDAAMATLEASPAPGEPIGGWRVWIGEFGHPCTNFPPDPKSKEDRYSEKRPGEPGYFRHLTNAETKAWLARPDCEAAFANLDAADAARRRFFGAKGSP